MQDYPVFLSLARIRILIVGFGEVGRRKLSLLLAVEPEKICILEPAPLSAESQALFEEAQAALGDRVQLYQEAFSDALLEEAELIYLCTSNHELNAHIAERCAALRKLCNCTDKPELGSLHIPSVARKGAVSVALSTGGASPALAKRWKGELQNWIGPKAAMTELMRRIRPRVLSLGYDSDINRGFFRSLSSKEIENALSAKNFGLLVDLLEERLPEPLRPYKEELIHGLDSLS